MILKRRQSDRRPDWPFDICPRCGQPMYGGKCSSERTEMKICNPCLSDEARGIRRRWQMDGMYMVIPDAKGRRHYVLRPNDEIIRPCPSIHPLSIEYYGDKVISHIGESDARKILTSKGCPKDVHKPQGLFIIHNGNGIEAMNNEDGNAWTEFFLSEDEAKKWLCGSIEYDHYYKKTLAPSLMKGFGKR